MTANAVAQLSKLATVTTSGAVTLGKHSSWNASSASLTATLPALTATAVATALTAGQIVRAKISKSKSDTSLNSLTVVCSGSDTFEGGTTSQTLLVAGEKITLSAQTIPGGSVPVWVIDEHTAPRDSEDSRFAPVGPQFHGCRYTAFGHSFGQVQSPVNAWAGSLYPARIRDLLHADASLYVNRTVSGSTMAQAATVATNNWVDGNGGLVTIMANQNDVGNRTAAASFKASFTSLLTTLLGGTGKPPTVLVIKDTACTSTGYARYSTPPTDADVATYNGYLDQVIATFAAGWIVVADPMADGWNPATMTAPDGQHPNDFGMSFIVASCLKALRTAPFRPGLNPGIATPLIASAPTTLTLAATAGNAQVALTGTGGSGATTIAVYRGTTATGTPIATALPFTDTGLTNGTAYSYVATATNAQGTVTSNVASATPSAVITTITDSFTRADSTTSMGSTETGAQAWTPSSGSVWGINSNRAYIVSPASPGSDTQTTVDTGNVGHFAQAKIVSGDDLGIIVGYQDASNYFLAYATSATKWSILKRSGGTYTTLFTSTVSVYPSDIVRLARSGSTITLTVNGTVLGTATDSAFPTAKRVGLRAGSATTYFDDFAAGTA